MNSLHHAPIESAGVTRRRFIAATLAAVPGLGAAAPDTPTAIDAHTHFYDPARPGGIAWPGKDDAALYRRAMPEDFKKLAEPLGIAGTVVIEASPVIADNQWLLELAAREPFILGVVGFLKPGRAGFADDLQRFAASAKFRGIRVGGWDGPVQGPDTPFGKDLRLIAERDLALDVMTDAARLPLVVALAAAMPSLRIVINHCAGVRFDGQSPPATWRDAIRACAPHANVFVKVSALVESVGPRGADIPADIAHYRAPLDVMWDSFGEDRLVFGSNWPVSAPFAPLALVHRLPADFARSKGASALAKLLAANARRAYKLPSQPAPVSK